MPPRADSSPNPSPRAAATPTVWRPLLLLRCLAVLLPGYHHPDEFFQGPEPMARDVLGLAATIPWEFAESPPCRSVLSALLTSGLPLGLVGVLGMPPAWLGAAVLLAPRLWMAGLSCAVDCAVLRLCRASGLEGSARPALLLLGTAWPCLLLLCRPLSNALETALLAAALSVAVGAEPPRPDASDAARWRRFGVISAAGVFTRFTFVVFGAVLGAWMALRALGNFAVWSVDRRRVVRVAKEICHGLAAFCLASACIVVLDSLYFGTLSLTFRGGAADDDGPQALTVPRLLSALLFGEGGAAAGAAGLGATLGGFFERLGRVGVRGNLTYTPLNR